MPRSKSLNHFTIEVDLFKDGYTAFSPELHIGGGGENLSKAFKDFIENIVYIRKNFSSTPANKLAQDAKDQLKMLKMVKRVTK